ncbi:MAG: glycyl-radical enzyme activating protein [Eubacteriales bacterium]|nr:glycyl-radical enzyme activating protein [Eubacteriales bacterium]
MTGTVFDIKQMAVFDGPGIRTTVFLKGCPLRCNWCHNPEGLSFEPELMVSDHGCRHCGRCREVCKNHEHCTACGACIRACPMGLRRICGTRMESKALAEKLLKDEEFLKKNGGGVTFSGGEPLGQPVFLLECLKELSSIHRAIETSGYCSAEWFTKILQELDYIMMDIKVVDEEKHLYYTGVSNRRILENLKILKMSGKPFRIRIPVIPGVNDTEKNYKATAELLKGAKHLEKVELLPYHQTAGAKYKMVGKEYIPKFHEQQSPKMGTEIFLNAGIRCECI